MAQMGNKMWVPRFNILQECYLKIGILEVFVHDSSSRSANSRSWLPLVTFPTRSVETRWFRVCLCCTVSLDSCSKTGFLSHAHRREIPYQMAAAITAEDSRFFFLLFDLDWQLFSLQKTFLCHPVLQILSRALFSSLLNASFQHWKLHRLL